jgi:hypothetical protein
MFVFTDLFRQCNMPSGENRSLLEPCSRQGLLRGERRNGSASRLFVWNVEIEYSDNRDEKEGAGIRVTLLHHRKSKVVKLLQYNDWGPRMHFVFVIIVC